MEFVDIMFTLKIVCRGVVRSMVAVGNIVVGLLTLLFGSVYSYRGFI